LAGALLKLSTCSGFTEPARFLGSYPPYGCHFLAGEVGTLLSAAGWYGAAAGWYGALAAGAGAGAPLLFGSYPPYGCQLFAGALCTVFPACTGSAGARVASGTSVDREDIMLLTRDMTWSPDSAAGLDSRRGT